MSQAAHKASGALVFSKSEEGEIFLLQPTLYFVYDPK